MRKLWNDEAGFIVSAELVLIATILVIGLIVGMVALRNQVVQELCDVGMAIGSLNQSYAFAGTLGFPACGAVGAWTGGSCYIDKIDFCQAHQNAGDPPCGVVLAGASVFPGVDWNGSLVTTTPTGTESP
jgi:hypothetical protein